MSEFGDNAKSEDDNPFVALFNVFEKRMKGKIHLTEPGVITEYDAKKQKASVKPVIRKDFENKDPQELPVIPDLPVAFPSGGGYSITWPLSEGDQVLLHVFTRPTDNWLSGGADDVETGRYSRFNLNDSVVYAGLRPFSDPLTEAQSDQLRIASENSDQRIKMLDNGEIVIESDNRKIKLESDGDIVLSPDSGQKVRNGKSTADKALAIAEDVANEIAKLTNAYNGHTHSGVKSGNDPTGPVSTVAPTPAASNMASKWAVDESS